jgi:hypothetical protein
VEQVCHDRIRTTTKNSPASNQNLSTMMYAHGLLALLVSFLTVTTAFQFASFGSKISPRSSQIRMSDVADQSAEVEYQSLVVSGFVSKENNFAESFTLSKLFKTGKWPEITTVTDDLKFARKRIVSPDSVYSGLMDILKFAVVDNAEEGRDASLEAAVSGNEAWLSFNVTTAQMPAYATIAAKAGVKRAVFAVYVGSEESGEGVTFDSACGILSAANIDYTIIKFGPVRKMEESKVPFRLVRGELALPTEGGVLSSEDLMRVSLSSVSQSIDHRQLTPISFYTSNLNDAHISRDIIKHP